MEVVREVEEKVVVKEAQVVRVARGVAKVEVEMVVVMEAERVVETAAGTVVVAMVAAATVVG